MATVTETVNMPDASNPAGLTVTVFLAGAGGAMVEGFVNQTSVAPMAAILSITNRDVTNGGTPNVAVLFRKKGVTTGGVWANGAVAYVAAFTNYTFGQAVVPCDLSAGVPHVQYKPQGYSPAGGEIYIDVVGYVW
jgi:hypothetical protein